MKTNFKNGNIIRVPNAKGNYATINNNILNNPNLSSDAIRLLMVLLNRSESWVPVLKHYQERFNWKKDQLTKATNNLIENGYLTRHQYSKGKGNGFTYFYNVSEYGNLNQSKVSSEPKSEPTQVAELIPELTDAQINEFNVTVSALVQKHSLPIEIGNEIVEHYTKKIEAGSLNGNNYDINKIISEIKQSTIKRRYTFLCEEIDRKITGTKDQQRKMKLKMNDWWEKIKTEDCLPTESDIKNKFAAIKASLITRTKAELDQRFQN